VAKDIENAMKGGLGNGFQTSEQTASLLNDHGKAKSDIAYFQQERQSLLEENAVMKAKLNECKKRISFLSGETKTIDKRNLSPEAELVKQKPSLRKQALDADFEVINNKIEKIKKGGKEGERTLISICNTASRIRRSIKQLNMELDKSENVLNLLKPKANNNPDQKTSKFKFKKNGPFGLVGDDLVGDESVFIAPEVKADEKWNVIQERRKKISDILSSRKIDLTKPVIRIRQKRDYVLPELEHASDEDEPVSSYEEEDNFVDQSSVGHRSFFSKVTKPFGDQPSLLKSPNVSSISIQTDAVQDQSNFFAMTKSVATSSPFNPASKDNILPLSGVSFAPKPDIIVDRAVKPPGFSILAAKQNDSLFGSFGKTASAFSTPTKNSEKDETPDESISEDEEADPAVVQALDIIAGSDESALTAEDNESESSEAELSNLEISFGGQGQEINDSVGFEEHTEDDADFSSEPTEDEQQIATSGIEDNINDDANYEAHHTFEVVEEAAESFEEVQRDSVGSVEADVGTSPEIVEPQQDDDDGINDGPVNESVRVSIENYDDSLEATVNPHNATADDLNDSEKEESPDVEKIARPAEINVSQETNDSATHDGDKEEASRSPPVVTIESVNNSLVEDRRNDYNDDEMAEENDNQVALTSLESLGLGTHQSDPFSNDASAAPTGFNTQPQKLDFNTGNQSGVETPTKQTSAFGGNQISSFGGTASSFGTPNNAATSSFAPSSFSSGFGTPVPQKSAFGSSANTSAFGTASTQPSAFTSPSKNAFGNTSTEPSAFGNPASQKNNAFGPSTNTSAFGTASTQPSAFTNSSPSRNAFGNTSNEPSAFGNPASQKSAFAPSTNTSAFGTTTIQPSAFGNPASQNSAFGTTSNQPTAFGNAPSQSSAFVDVANQTNTFNQSTSNTSGEQNSSTFVGNTTSAFTTPQKNTFANGQTTFGQSGFANIQQPGFGQSGFTNTQQPSFGQSGFGQTSRYDLLI
jgi:hypothetical protein